jgi:hypothetical protein
MALPDMAEAFDGLEARAEDWFAQEEVAPAPAR